MSTAKFIELDSNYRNRNEYPNPGDFVVEFAGAVRSQAQALDPISYAYPKYVFSPSDFDAAGNQDGYVTVNYKVPSPTYQSLDTSSNFNFVVYATSTVCIPHQEQNYYNGCIIKQNNTGPQTGSVRRITSWKYLNTNATGSFYLVEPEAPFTPFNEDAQFEIYNATDLSDPNHALMFLPQSLPYENFTAYSKMRLYNQTQKQSLSIAAFDGTTRLMSIEKPVPASWVTNDIYCIRREDPIVKDSAADFYITAFPGQNTIRFNANIDTNYINAFIRFFDPSKVDKGLIYRIVGITNYINDNLTPPTPNVYEMTVYPALDLATIGAISGPPAPFTPHFEILQFTKDNNVMLSYSGSMTSMQQMVAYEIQLLNLSLPNVELKSGSKTALYNYVYVELQNVSAPNAGVYSSIYSNNPNSKKATFRATISDMNDPIRSPFVNIDGDGMRQVIAFRPNDNLRLTVRLPTGDLLEPLVPDTTFGQTSNSLSQISALFQITRIA